MFCQFYWQGAQKNNISINEVALKNDHMIEQCYTEEEAEQLCNLLVDTDSNWLWQSIHKVQVDEVNAGTPVLYNLMIRNTPVQGSFDTGASMSIMSKKFYNQIQHRPKLIMCNRLLFSAGGDSLQPVGEYFVQMKTGKKISRDHVIVVKNLSRPFILGVATQKINRMGTGYSRPLILTFLKNVGNKLY